MALYADLTADALALEARSTPPRGVSQPIRVVERRPCAKENGIAERRERNSSKVVPAGVPAAALSGCPGAA